MIYTSITIYYGIKKFNKYLTKALLPQEDTPNDYFCEDSFQNAQLFEDLDKAETFARNNNARVVTIEINEQKDT